MKSMSSRKSVSGCVLTLVLALIPLSGIEAQQNPSDNPLAGPLPFGEPSSPPTRRCDAPVTVTLFDSSGLEEWLQGKSGNKMRVVGVVPLGEGKSLVVFGPCNGKAPTVTIVENPLTPADLQSRINATSKRTFVGVHRLGESYAIVFRSRDSYAVEP